MYVKEYSPDLIHSRRLGWFKVARRMINHEPEKVKVLMIGIIVLETYVCIDTDEFKYLGVCDYFPEVEEDHEPPEYTLSEVTGYLTSPQPPPIKGERKVLDLVIDDFRRKAEMGKHKYGTYLETNNGRNPLIDAYQEAIDLCMYLRQAIGENA